MPSSRNNDGLGVKEGRNGRGGPNELEVAVAAYQIEITNSRSKEKERRRRVCPQLRLLRKIIILMAAFLGRREGKADIAGGD